MSLFDYHKSSELEGAPFYALIMAAMRGADSSNIEKLKVAWPDVWSELQTRYNSPGGWLSGDRPKLQQDA